MRSIGISDTTSVRLTTQDRHWGSNIIMSALGLKAAINASAGYVWFTTVGRHRHAGR
jgi:hypothetical protein